MAVKVVLQKRLEPWRWGAQWLPIRRWQWPTEKIIEVDPLTTQQVAQEFNVNHPMVIWHLKQIGKVKKLDKRWLHIKKKKLTAYQKKIIILKCHLLLFCATTTDYISNGLWCVMKSGFYVTTNNDQLCGWTEKKLQSTSQSHILSHGHCLVVCYCSDPLPFSESQWNHYIWEVCSTNQWDALKTAVPAAVTGQQKRPSSSQQRPTTCHITNISKVGWNGLQILPL